MSTSEHLFFDPGTANGAEATLALGRRLSLDVVGGDDRRAIVLPRPSGSLVCRLEENDYQAFEPDPEVPEDHSIFDRLPFLFRMNLVPKDGTMESQRLAGRLFFDLCVQSELRWPLVLVHEFELLVATYDVGRGVREFPPGTRSDGTDEHLWR